ncbi:CRE-PEB-1 protein [Aphelenchoides avenae]|nr:CRE-PEB-1 protein [Aphelenchus avenae]
MYTFKIYDPSAPYVMDTLKAKARKLLFGGYSYNVHHSPTRRRPEKSWRCTCSKKLAVNRTWCRGRALSWNGGTEAVQQSEHNHAPNHAQMEVEYVKGQLMEAVVSLPNVPVDLLVDEAKKVLTPGLRLCEREDWFKRSLLKARTSAKAARLVGPSVTASALCETVLATATPLEFPKDQRSGNVFEDLVADETDEQSSSSNATSSPYEKGPCGSSFIERDITVAAHQLAASLMSSILSHHFRLSEQELTQSSLMSSPGCSTLSDNSSVCSSPPAKSARLDSATAFDVAFNASLLSASFGGATPGLHVSDAVSPPWAPSTPNLSPLLEQNDPVALTCEATNQCLQLQQKYSKLDDIEDRFSLRGRMSTANTESPSRSSIRSGSSFTSPSSTHYSSAGTQTCMTDLLEAYRSLEEGNALALDECFAQPTTDFQCLAIPVCCCPMGVCSTACSNVMKRPCTQIHKKS